MRIVQLVNQSNNSKKTHEADVKRRKMCASKSQLSFGFASDWLGKLHGVI